MTDDSSTPTMANTSYIRDLARTRIFSRADGTVSDEILELLEIHVPQMIEEINRLRSEVDDFHAAEVLHGSELRRLRKLESLIQQLGLKMQYQFLTIESPDGPIQAEFSPDQFMKLEPVSRLVAQINEHLS